MIKSHSIIIKIAVGYVRTSGIINPDTSIESQIFLIKEYCDKNGIILKEIFVDERKSATTTKGRFEYKKLKKLIQSDDGIINTVIVTFADRIGREAFEFVEFFLEMKERGIEFISVQENLTSSTMSYSDISTKALSIEQENQARTKRIMISKESSIKHGCHIFKDIYGYLKTKDRTLEINEEEAKTVRLIYSKFINGEKVSSIAKSLNECGIFKMVKGKPTQWSHGSVRNILLNETYSTGITTSGVKCPILIESSDFSIVQSRFASNKSNTPYQKHFHLFQGIIICPICFSNMKCSSQNNRYFCDRRDHKIHVDKDLFDDLALNYLEDSQRSLSNEEQNGYFTKQMKIQLQDIADKKNDLCKQYALNRICKQTFSRNFVLLNAEVSRIGHEAIINVPTTSHSEIIHLIRNQSFNKLQEYLIENGVKLLLDPKTNQISERNTPSSSLK